MKGGCDRYEVCCQDDSKPITKKAENDGKEVHIDISDLQPGHDYTFSVKAICDFTTVDGDRITLESEGLHIKASTGAIFDTLYALLFYEQKL